MNDIVTMIHIHNPHEGGKFKVPIIHTNNSCLYLPRKGETIRVNGLAYVVQDVVWDYEEEELKRITVEAR